MAESVPARCCTARVYAAFVIATLIALSAVTTVSTSGAAGADSAAARQYVFPLSVATDKRHLVDARGTPFLIIGDAPWSLMVDPDNAGADRYLETRKAQGVTAILLNLVEHKFDTHGAPKDAYGDAPFRTPGDFSTPNEAYFAHADRVIEKARSLGIAVFLFPAYLGYQGGDEGWYREILANGPAKMYAYGRYVGTRYRNDPNIVWAIGGDYGPNAALGDLRQLVAGIQATDSHAIFTVHNGRYQSGVTQYTPGDRWLDVNTTYSDCTQAPKQLAADYRRPGPIPFFFIEGRYEGEGASPVCIRSQAYWSLLEGGIGEFFGNHSIWSFAPNWPAALTSQGSKDMTRFGKLMLSRAWWKLAPDAAHKVLTGGYGDIGSSGYAAAARTTDGKTVIVYTPSRRALTIDMRRIAGPTAKAWWYNPATGRSTAIGTLPTIGPRTFAPPAASDWVLVIDDARARVPRPGARP